MAETLTRHRVETDYSSSISKINRAYSIYAQHGDTCKMAWLSGHICNTYDVLGKLDSALIVGQKGLSLFRPPCDSLKLMSITVFVSNVYLSLGENEKTLNMCEDALRRWNPSWGYGTSKDGLYTNRAISLAYMGRFDEALEAFRDVLSNAIKAQDAMLIREAYMNMGGMFGMLSGGTDQVMLDSAEKYIFKALELIRTIDPIGKDMMTLYSNVAALKADRGDHKASLVYTDSSIAIAKRLGDLPMQITLLRHRSKNYRDMGDHRTALDELENYIILNDSLLNIEKVKSIADMQEKYESEKKAGEIKELKIQNLDSQLKQERATRTRNITIIIGVIILLLALALWNRLSYTRRTKAVIEKEKQRSEELLLNILPEEVAEELKDKGHSDAQLIDHVTVLFTDFKGFTALSEQVTPKELVADLHECFSAFDNICEKYGIEKIKTIGDAYMAAGGLPSPNTTHAQDVVNAALEMKEVVEKGKMKKVEQGLPFFEIRIGVHTGPVVAGIVGVKKFQYDIWGDTVNTASRMESSGEVGKVNISETTYELVKDQFTCEYRGEVEAKGKGKMKMYFVENLG